MGNLVRSLFSRGKPAAAESRYPNPAYIIPNLVYAVLLSDHNTECEACSFYDRWMWDLAHKIILGGWRSLSWFCWSRERKKGDLGSREVRALKVC